ncbi:thioredoxin [Niallia circulans]|uniref:thioredoxin family protein n=1 Tax=Niallia circulans TaxID=1397 RepID=UPI000F454021|nr:thioredoxin family protein [Niallia circulans]AYV67693.1 thioredoxin [Niallia circulans]AYV73962.1 thioredoxin [Niallia circulans]
MAIRKGNNNNFDQLTSEGFALVDFYSDTCNPCKILAVILEEVDKDLPFINTVKVNITDEKEMSEKFGIMAVPTIVFMKDGEEVERHIGVLREEEIKEKISKYYY